MSSAATYLFLGIAIVLEVFATSMLKASDGFTKLGPSLLTVAGYAISFYCLAQALRVLPAGIAYAIWSGVGIVLISAIGWIWFRQALDGAALAGMGLIIAGVVVVNVFSTSSVH